MRVLRASHHKRMAWKNGGGETIEVAVHPPGAGLADFDWRVSMASVAADGPFSAFPGVDRTLALLSGDGMELEIEGLGHHRLTPGSAPFAFPADASTLARLVGGSITDLNVMTRRGVFGHKVTCRDSLPFEAEGRWILLLAVDRASIVVDGRTVLLESFDAVVLEGEATVARHHGEGAVNLFVVEIDAVS